MLGRFPGQPGEFIAQFETLMAHGVSTTGAFELEMELGIGN